MRLLCFINMCKNFKICKDNHKQVIGFNSNFILEEPEKCKGKR